MPIGFAGHAVVVGMVCAARLAAQDSVGMIRGLVVDAFNQKPLEGVTVSIANVVRPVQTRGDGSFLLNGVPVGTHQVQLSHIGYSPERRNVLVTAGATATLRFELVPQALMLDSLVVTGYGSQRREAITGSVATIDPEVAGVGVMTNVNQMIQGRAAGVQIVLNNGEPGAGAQIRIRGGTSISASNEPLYVIDGVPIQNVETEPIGFAAPGSGNTPPLPRSPLNLLNPSDIASITILKDAAATAIYGSRAANGVVLIETKKGSKGATTIEYDGYVATASPARHLNVLDGGQYRQFITEQVQAGNLTPDRLARLGEANTNWEREVTRSAVAYSHNVSLSGGGESSRYRASLNYLNQQGVVLANGLERIQGRFSASNRLLQNRLRLEINLTTSHVNNDYLPYENTGSFEGGVFLNEAVFNPTYPVKVGDAYYEIGTGRQSVRNPVAMAEQISDFGTTTGTIGNVSAEVDVLAGLTGRINVGAARSDGSRQIYLPKASPVGAEWNGLARQSGRRNNSLTFQGTLSYIRAFGKDHSIDVLGGYEASDYTTSEFGAEGRDYLTDALGSNSLSGASVLVPPWSWRTDSRLVSFFARGNYSFRNRYFVTGVLRYDGSSRFGTDNKWALFPALSGSWQAIGSGPESTGLISALRLRAGFGLQGNPAVPPYASLLLLETTGDSRYVFGELPVTGVAPVRNANPDLKWEQTAQYNVAIDFGLLRERIVGTIEYYVKNTSDLLLEVPVPQPAVAPTRLENIGSVRNQGLEVSLDALAVSKPRFTWRAGLVFATAQNRVVELGRSSFISTGYVSGQGQSGQVSQRIMPGYPLGTFFGPRFIGVNAEGQQLFEQYEVRRDSTGRELSRQLIGQTTQPGGDDYVPLGTANPDFIAGLTSQVTWGRFDGSLFLRWESGGEVFNNTALVYSTKGNALQDKNFLASALDDPTGISEPSIYSSRWIESRTFLRLQNLTIGYRLDLPTLRKAGRSARVYLSGDNLLLLTGYSGLDPEAHAESGVASRGIDYLSYPRPRTVSAGLQLTF